MDFLDFRNYRSSLYEQNLIKESFEISNIYEARNLSSEIDENIKFAIIMATHKVSDDIGSRSGREKHKPQLESFKECLQSIKNQKHKGWKLFVCADCYEGDEELVEVIESVLEKGDYWYYNLPKPGERDNPTVKNSGAMHKLCGPKAWNTALESAMKENFKYGIRIGHDDVWTPDHLEIHAKAYTQYPESTVVWTKTSKKKANGNGIARWPNNGNISIEYNNLTFKEGNTADVYSWQIEPFKTLRWRSTDQKTTAPRRKDWLPGDVDMWSRMGDIINDKQLKVVYVPRATYRYRNKFGQLP